MSLSRFEMERMGGLRRAMQFRSTSRNQRLLIAALVGAVLAIIAIGVAGRVGNGEARMPAQLPDVDQANKTSTLAPVDFGVEDSREGSVLPFEVNGSGGVSEPATASLVVPALIAEGWVPAAASSREGRVSVTYSHATRTGTVTLTSPDRWSLPNDESVPLDAISQFTVGGRPATLLRGAWICEAPCLDLADGFWDYDVVWGLLFDVPEASQRDGHVTASLRSYGNRPWGTNEEFVAVAASVVHHAQE